MDFIGAGDLRNISDDRVKFDERQVTNAVRTLLKLNPQRYTKEQGDISMDEAGLVVQELWYDAPELRYLIEVPRGADPSPTRPPKTDDPSVDPPYESWGTSLASMRYEPLLAYLIRAIREQHVVKRLVTDQVDCTNLLVRSIDGGRDVALSNVAHDGAVIGVVSDKEVYTVDREVVVDSTGETYVWVTDEGGHLHAGDLVASSNVPGYAMRQGEDDVVHSYTAARVLLDCDFTQPTKHRKIVSKTLQPYTIWTKTTYLPVTANTPSDEVETITETYYERRTRREVTPHAFTGVMPQWEEVLYTKQNRLVIDASAYEFLPASEKHNYVEQEDGTYVNENAIFLTQEEWASLTLEEQEPYRKGYYVYDVEERFEPTEGFSEFTRQVDKWKIVHRSQVPREGYVSTTEQKMQSVMVDGHIQWVDDPDPEAQDPLYPIRYLTQTGEQVTRLNAVRTAALLPCVLVA